MQRRSAGIHARIMWAEGTFGHPPTSFAVMERLGLRRATSFDAGFSVYRFGLRRSKAFEVVR